LNEKFLIEHKVALYFFIVFVRKKKRNFKFKVSNLNFKTYTLRKKRGQKAAAYLHRLKFNIEVCLSKVFWWKFKWTI